MTMTGFNGVHAVNPTSPSFSPPKGLQVQVPCNSQKVASAGIPCIQTSAFLSGAATGAGLMILSIAVVTLFFSGLPRGRRVGARPPPSLES